MRNERRLSDGLLLMGSFGTLLEIAFGPEFEYHSVSTFHSRRSFARNCLRQTVTEMFTRSLN